MGDEGRMIVDTPPAPQYDTRRDAMKSVAGKLSDLEAQIIEFVRSRGPIGATCYEIETSLELSHQTASSRCADLYDTGQLRDTGLRRKTGSNRSARVYAIGDGTPPPQTFSKTKVLQQCREKLMAYRNIAGDSYVGGVEFTELIRRIDAALA